MRSFVVALALLACACGDVQKLTDAGGIDAYVPDAEMPLTCGPGEMVCNGSCANVMTSELYCGNCQTQCAPTLGCFNGACVPANTSCTRVKELDADATDGAYRNPNTNTVFYCDFTARKQYDFGLGVWNAGYAGYASMTVAAFDDATKAAFIGFYNLAGGIPTIAPFTSNTCCVTQTNNLELSFGTVPNFMTLAQGGAWACNISYNGIYQIYRGQPGFPGEMIMSPPLADDFFTTNPVSEAASCSDGGNIGLFRRVTSF